MWSKALPHARCERKDKMNRSGCLIQVSWTGPVNAQSQRSSIMRFTYKSAHIDVTPAVTATGFKARAKMNRELSEGEDAGNEKYERDLGSFATSTEAVEYARRWAIDYCDANWF
jgi:hypothetical protein